MSDEVSFALNGRTVLTAGRVLVLGGAALRGWALPASVVSWGAGALCAGAWACANAPQPPTAV
jgi:hypothetical protein